MPSEYSWYFLFFGIPTWALVDGTWSSLSQLADRLPEGYNISAYLILSLTVGNIFPLLVGCIMEKSFSLIFLKQLIYLILLVGCMTGILIGAFYSSSVTIAGSEVSLPLCILFFIVGACSSSSNVTHFTFVSSYPATNTTALGTGMGIGSMIAGILGILQGIWLIDYGFNTTIYYIVLSLLYLPALYSFYELLQKEEKFKESETTSFLDDLIEDGSHSPTTSPILQDTEVNIEIVPSSSSSQQAERTQTSSSSLNSLKLIQKYASILSLQAFNSSLGYGFVPALISYACGKFPNANTILLFATGTAAIVDPWTKYLTNYYRLATFSQLLTASAILFFLACGLILCCALPSSSSFYAEGNSFFPVVCYILFNGLFGYTNISIFRYFKDQTFSLSSSLKEKSEAKAGGEGEEEEQKRWVQTAYRWSGIASQTGALLGSILAFSLVISNSL